MRNLRYAGLWKAIGYVLVAAVIAGSLAPPPPDAIEINDKLIHAVTYLILALWFGAIYLGNRFAWLAAALVALGIGIEFAQGASGYRDFEWADMLADTVGITVGLLLAATRLGEGLIALERYFWQRRD